MFTTTTTTTTILSCDSIYLSIYLSSRRHNDTDFFKFLISFLELSNNRSEGEGEKEVGFVIKKKNIHNEGVWW